jgi:excisionase family DNA binding protein
LLSVPEAAALIRASEATIWRWIRKGALPSYRVGPKRVFVKRDDLTAQISPDRRKNAGLSAADRWRLHAAPMSSQERSAIDLIREARALRARQLAIPGWSNARQAWEDINEMRDERAREQD